VSGFSAPLGAFFFPGKAGTVEVGGNSVLVFWLHITAVRPPTMVI